MCLAAFLGIVRSQAEDIFIRSISLDGNEHVDISPFVALPVGHTLEAWFKTVEGTGAAGSEATIISYMPTSGSDDSVLSVQSDKLNWNDFDAGTDEASSTVVNDGNWHHGVAVINATTQKIYVDGELETTSSQTYSIGTEFQDFVIGARADLLSRYFNGSLDELKIYNRELSAPEITKNYKHGKSKHS